MSTVTTPGIRYPFEIHRERYRWPTFSDAEFARRHALVHAWMDENGYDGIVVYGHNGIWERGWANIRSVYERLFAAKVSYHFEFWDYTLHQTREVFFVVGRERGRLETDKGALDFAIRTTRLFVREGSGWRQLHHHGSIDDPEMLSKYQGLVLGR